MTPQGAETRFSAAPVGFGRLEPGPAHRAGWPPELTSVVEPVAWGDESFVGRTVSIEEGEVDHGVGDLIGKGGIEGSIVDRRQSVQQGKVDGFVINNVSAAAFVLQSQKGPKPAVMLEQEIYVQPMGIGMTKGETALIKEVNGILHKLEASGYMDQHWKKWFGEDSDFKLKRPYKVTPIKDVKFEAFP